MTGLEKVYLGCAIFGGGSFVLRTLLMLLGADHADDGTHLGDTDVEVADVDGDLAHAHDLAGAYEVADADGVADANHAVDTHHVAQEAVSNGHHGHLDPGLKLLTFQGALAFLMMFGLGGLSVSRSWTAGPLISLTVGCLCGIFAMWLVAKGFNLMGKLQSSGTMDIYDALAEEGTVYLTIPADGTGQVQVPVSGRLKVLSAVSQNHEELKTGVRVHVADIDRGTILVVRKA